MATLRRVGRVWWADLYIDGKRVRKSLKTDVKFQAQHRLRELEADLKARAGDGDVRLDDFAVRYLEWARTSKPASAPLEAKMIAKVGRFLAGEGVTRLAEVTPYHVERMRAHLLDENLAEGRVDKDGNPVPARHRTRTTVNRYCQLLRGMFYRARDWDLYTKDNPLRRVKFYREGAKIRPLTDDEVGRVMDAVRAVAAGKRSSAFQRLFHDLCVLVLNTGLRRSEALGIRWTDIGDGELIVRGKGGKVRTVPLNAEAQAAIRRQPRAGAYVFDVPNRASCSLIRRTSEHVSRLAGVAWHLHLFRHTFASRLLARGVDIVTVSDLLGHGKVMTSLLYTHTDPARKRAAVNGLASK
jgi:integrase